MQRLAALVAGAALAGCGVVASPPASPASAAARVAGQRPARVLGPGAARASATPGSRRPPTASGPACVAATSHWPLARLAAQTITIPVAETAVGSVGELVAAGFGGLLLFGNTAPADLGSQIRALDGLAPGRVPPLVMTDEEGGGIQRMANLVGYLPWPRSMAASETPAQVTASVRAVASRMRAAGVDVDLAPVLDLNGGAGPDAANPDGPRSFSTNPAIAVSYAQAFAAGLADAGVLAVFKHFPGLGRATGNTDLRTAYVPDLASLASYDLIPFRAQIAAGAKAIMVSNAIISGGTGEPVVFSPSQVLGLLRDQLGFHGLIVTDSLSAEAIVNAGFDLPTAAVRAIASGADLLLFGPTAAARTESIALGMRNALVAAVAAGRLSRATLLAAANQVLAADRQATC